MAIDGHVGDLAESVPFDYTLGAGKKTGTFLNVLSTIVSGADSTTKLTKAIKAIIGFAAYFFATIHEGWKVMAAQLANFHEVVDLFMTPADIKNIYDLVRGEVKTWMENARTICFAVFRILATSQFLHNLKLINLGSLVNTVGSIPVFGLVANGFALLGMGFDLAFGSKKLHSKELQKKVLQAHLEESRWKAIQAHHAHKSYETMFKQVLQFSINANERMAETGLANVDKIPAIKAKLDALEALGKRMQELVGQIGNDPQVQARAISGGLKRVSQLVNEIEQMYVAASEDKVVAKNDCLAAFSAMLTKGSQKGAVSSAVFDEVVALATLLKGKDLFNRVDNAYKKALVNCTKVDAAQAVKKLNDLKDRVKTFESLTDNDIYFSHKLSLKVKEAGEKVEVSEAKLRSSRIAVIINVIKVASLAIGIAGMCGCLFFSGVPLIALSLTLVSCSIALFKVFYDKIYAYDVKEWKIREKTPFMQEVKKGMSKGNQDFEKIVRTNKALFDDLEAFEKQPAAPAA